MSPTFVVGVELGIPPLFKELMNPHLAGSAEPEILEFATAPPGALCPSPSAAKTCSGGGGGGGSGGKS
jgi:hypothetical protein